MAPAASSFFGIAPWHAVAEPYLRAIRRAFFFRVRRASPLLMHQAPPLLYDTKIGPVAAITLVSQRMCSLWFRRSDPERVDRTDFVAGAPATQAASTAS